MGKSTRRGFLGGLMACVAVATLGEAIGAVESPPP